MINILSGHREKGDISDIDLEICRFLRQRHEHIAEDVLLAACLVSYQYRRGNVCLLLEEYASQPVFEEMGEGEELEAPDMDRWVSELEESPVVGSPGAFRPLILDADRRLYFHKLWHYENVLAEQLVERSGQQYQAVDLPLLRDGLDRLFGTSEQEPDWQQVGAASAVLQKLSVISGGPGTGKTTTIVRVLALLLEQASAHDETLNIALAAPTGKAAARLKESIVSAKEGLKVSGDIRKAIPEEAVTIHQLLGARRHTATFKYNKENPLPYDAVIVDEASMVDQALMSKLVNAMVKDSRLILLGDKDQLASVEAGSVLGDICNVDGNRFSGEMIEWLNALSLNVPKRTISDHPKSLTDNITLLSRSYRFAEDSGIGRLATSVNEGRDNEVLEILNSSDYGDVALRPVADQPALEKVLKEYLTDYVKDIQQGASAEQSLRTFNRFRILAAHRRGPWGVEYLNRLAESVLQRERLIPKYQQWYPGKPVIVNVNNYSLGLHNGDTGICLRDANGKLKIYFRNEDRLRAIAPGRLPDHSTAFALTVHKSQGSEFEDVILILPDTPSKVLSRELIYTAITRARTTLSILGGESVLRSAVRKQLQRSSGLRDRLWG